MSRAARPTLNVATLQDVARVAGVSPATVSRVINDDKNVRATTRDKVNDAVRELNYVPNLAARSLASAAQVRLGVIYSNPSAAYLSAFLLGAMDECAARGGELLLVRCEAGDEDSERAAITRLMDSAVSGVLLPSPRTQASVLGQMLADVGLPTVTIGSGGSPDAFSRVHVDDQVAAWEMTRHLLDLGHRRIGFIKGHPSLQSSHARAQGFAEAMAETPCATALEAQGFFTFSSALAAAEELLGHADRPTAIFASNDDMAAAVVSVAHRRGLDVPGDLTVVGFDDTQIAVTLWPPLTTVRQPMGEMAAAAIDLLMREIRLARAGQPSEPLDHVVPHVLVRRQSSSPPLFAPQALAVGAR